MGTELSDGSIISEVSDLVKLTKELKIIELKVERGDVKIHIRRACVREPSIESVLEQAVVPGESQSNLVLVLAPMVGRFYRSTEPEGDPLVSVGQRVNKGQRLCIIESMKILNDVLSDHEGSISAVLTEDGHGVEYGQPLFEIDTAYPVNDAMVEDDNPLR